MNSTAAAQDPLIALEVRSRQLAAVNRISRQMYSTLDLDERLRGILGVSMEAVEASAGTIYLHRAADDKLVFRYVVGEKSEQLTGMAVPPDQGLCGEVFQSGVPQITNMPNSDPSFHPAVGERVGFHTESVLTVPLMYQAGKPVGVMQILNKQDGHFDLIDLEVLEIVASMAAVAIENAQLHRDAELSAVAHAVGDLSHDIKNKVTPIVLSVDTVGPMLDDMFTQLGTMAASLTAAEQATMELATGALRGFYPEALEICRTQVQEIQDYTRLIADALKGIISEPSMDPGDLNGIISRQLDSLEPVAANHQLRLVRVLGEIPTVRFDRFLIERAVYNLVNNAIPETPQGGSITISTRIEPEPRFTSGKAVVIEVRDTGRGMPVHVLDRILLGDAKSTKPGGTGLGTRIVFNAVSAHHGIFDGDSAPEMGTAFRMRLPYMA